MTHKFVLEDAFGRVSADLNGVPDLQIACGHILNLLDETKDVNLRHLTFGMLKNASLADDELTAQAIAYLSGDVVRALKMCFEFIDEENRIFHISPSDVRNAERFGEFFHPEKGEAVPDFQNKVYVYFMPSWLTSEESDC